MAAKRAASASQTLCDAIGSEYGCEPSDCDVHSAADLAVDLKLISIDEASSELGFATIAQWIGVDVGY